MSRLPLKVRHYHRHCQKCTLGNESIPILFSYDTPPVVEIDDMEFTVKNFGFARLVLKLCAKKAFKRLIERLVTLTGTS